MTSLAACVRKILLAVTAAGCLATAGAADLATTWSRYFPEQPAAPADEAGWASLAQTFPNRVKPVASAVVPPPPTPAATRLEIKPGIDYVRVRQLASDLDVIGTALATPRLIIDLRYVHGELAPALAFGARLAREPRSLEDGTIIAPGATPRAADQVALCLVNRGTSGALEAVLDALQHAGDVLLVGTQTAGDTGDFIPVSGAPAWRVITGDYRRAGGHSLLDVGVTPGLFVETTPDGEDAAYLAFDASKPVAELLDVPVVKNRFDEARLQQHFEETHPGNGRSHIPEANRTPAPEAGNPDAAAPGAEARPGRSQPEATADAPPPFDRSLQRAVATLVADTVFRDRAPVR